MTAVSDDLEDVAEEVTGKVATADVSRVKGKRATLQAVSHRLSVVDLDVDALGHILYHKPKAEQICYELVLILRLEEVSKDKQEHQSHPE